MILSFPTSIKKKARKLIKVHISALLRRKARLVLKEGEVGRRAK